MENPLKNNPKIEKVIDEIMLGFDKNFAVYKGTMFGPEYSNQFHGEATPRKVKRFFIASLQEVLKILIDPRVAIINNIDNPSIEASNQEAKARMVVNQHLHNIINFLNHTNYENYPTDN